jgi:Zinc dependent phospholipase C
MPPLGIHTRIAKDMADRLGEQSLDSQRGNLYLGSTAPDIRVITKWERQRTHFFDVHNFDNQDSVPAFLEANPALAEAGTLDDRTRSFIAGYLSHLVADEIWIGTIYRPYFGERSPLGGSIRANVMDRALQFSMDADVRTNGDLMAHVVKAVAECDLDIDIGFLDAETLRRWHEVISEFVNSQPDWERFRLRARRHVEEAGHNVDDAAEDLARSLPQLVDEALRYLSRERIDEAIGESLDASVRVARDYLRCA